MILDEFLKMFLVFRPDRVNPVDYNYVRNYIILEMEISKIAGVKIRREIFHCINGI